MLRFLFCLGLCSGLPCGLWSQEIADSLQVDSGLSEQEIRELTEPLHGGAVTGSSALVPTLLSTDGIEIQPALEPVTPTAPTIRFDLYPKGSQLTRWASGFLYGYNYTQQSLLMGYSAHAGMGVQQRLGQFWQINAGVGLHKYSVFYNTASTNASLTWQPNAVFATTVFGGITSPSFASSLQYGPSFYWGGYVTLQTDTELPFGIDAGARTGYDPLSGHWVTPIVQPFVKIGNSKMGFDFGPLLQNALQKANGRGRGNGFSPIPRPPKNLPAVAPRR